MHSTIAAAAIAAGLILAARRCGVFDHLKSQSHWLLYGLVLSLPLAGAAVDLILHERERTESAVLAGIESIAWPRSASESARPKPRAAFSSPSTGSVSPVGALIGGLERRLAHDPEDASGWALLAQTYAFLRKPSDAEAATVRAIELGIDEADLRHRVALASRAPDSTAGLGTR